MFILDPFKGQDLAKVTKAELDAVKAMREAAETQETEGFNPAIAKAGGTKTTAGAALQRGKIQNKVLKLVVSLLVLCFCRSSL